MKPLLALAITAVYVGAAAGSFGEKGAASSVAFRITTAQASTVPAGVPASAAVAPAQREERDRREPQKPFDDSLWLYIAFGIVGTVVIVAPWLIVTGLAISTHLRADFRRLWSDKRHARAPGTKSFDQ